VSFLPGILTKNWQLKLAALAMAVLLWTVPRFEVPSSQVLDDIPVRVDLNDPEWSLVGDPSPSTVSVIVSGPARELIRLGVDRPPILVPIDEISSPDTTVRLRDSWFRFSERDGVVVEDLRPGLVTLSFERIVERRIPFSVPLFGELPQGLSRAGPPVITEPSAVVYGPASRLERLDSLRLVPLDLSRLEESGPFLLEVDTAGLHELDVIPVQASVSIPTEPTIARELPDQRLQLPRMESDPQLQAQRSSVTVVLLGARSLVEAVDAGSLVVTIPTGRVNLAPGQEERVMVVVEGVPELVEARTRPELVLLRRPVGQ